MSDCTEEETEEREGGGEFFAMDALHLPAIKRPSGQAMPRAHCSLTVDARHAPLHPLPCTPTELQQQQQQAVILAFAWPWSGAGAGAGAGLGLGQAAHMLINNFD